MTEEDNNKANNETTERHYNRNSKQSHKKEIRRTAERWLDKIQIRHVYDSIQTKQIRRLVYVGGQYDKDKNVNKQHYYYITTLRIHD